MRAILFAAIALLLTTSSCRMPHLPYTHTACEPYVQLKDGAKFKGTSAERSKGLFVKDKIILGDTSFRTRDVSFYSTGGGNYANVGRKNFATQVADGKINLYKYTTITTTTTSHGGSSSHTNNYFYIQQELGAPVEYLNYRNLAAMVQPRTPEFSMLEKYRKTRIVSRSLGYGSLTCLAGGIALAEPNGGTGAALIGTGIVAGIGWFCVYGSNHSKLLRSVLIADKSDKKGKHTRVD